MTETFETLAAAIRACRACVDAPLGAPLPHDPRPVFRGLPSARLLIAGQAPGSRVHASGVPFTDPSGDRLRAWTGLTPEVFYDEARVAIVPMGFCFPGHDSKGGDLPPRRECVATWHDQLMPSFPELSLVLVIGRYAEAYHFRRLGLAGHRKARLADTLLDWRAIHDAREAPRVIPLPHPSWRNSGWLKRHPWFEAALVPVLRRAVADALDIPGPFPEAIRAPHLTP